MFKQLPFGLRRFHRSRLACLRAMLGAVVSGAVDEPVEACAHGSCHACAQVQLTVPFSRTSFSSKASFEVRSPKLLNVRIIKLPERASTT